MEKLAALVAKDYVTLVFTGKLDLSAAWIIGILLAGATVYCLAKILKAYLNRFK